MHRVKPDDDIVKIALQRRGRLRLFVSDGTATHTDYEHNSTLNAMMLTFADVVSTEDVVKLLRA